MHPDSTHVRAQITDVITTIIDCYKATESITKCQSCPGVLTVKEILLLFVTCWFDVCTEFILGVVVEQCNMCLQFGLRSPSHISCRFVYSCISFFQYFFGCFLEICHFTHVRCVQIMG